MLKKVTITNYLGRSVTYSFEEPTLDDESGLFITSIDGLGPVKANINMTDLVTSDGSVYNSSRLNSRNIVIHANFTYAKTIEEARLMSYQYFPIGRKVSIRIETNNRIADTTGYVESNEPDIFSDLSSVQISILCESAFFSSADPSDKQKIDFSNSTPLFEFPFSNESVSQKKIEFGRLIHRKRNNFRYEGDSETGCTITINAIGTVENIEIINAKTNGRMKIDTDKLEALTGDVIVNGDTITICTVKGHKSITLLRNGVETNILNVLGKDAEWFQLSRGDNEFAYDAEEGEPYIRFYIEVNSIFEGV